MASFASSSSTSTSSSSTSTTASNHGINPSLLPLSNMASMVTVKLDYNNYLVWRHQIEVILEAYSLISFIEDSNGAPDPFLKDSSGNYTTEANPEYVHWKNCEQALFKFLNSTLSPPILALTVGQKSGIGVQKILEKCFSSISRSHILGLWDELMSLKKGTEPLKKFVTN